MGLVEEVLGEERGFCCCCCCCQPLLAGTRIAYPGFGHLCVTLIDSGVAWGRRGHARWLWLVLGVETGHRYTEPC